MSRRVKQLYDGVDADKGRPMFLLDHNLNATLLLAGIHLGDEKITASQGAPSDISHSFY
jgi:hypothetical protein